ncbi:multidrug resistance efflux transporter family protein [Pseudodesulfovibrio cashew]|uniref:Multidrug resistance efflux transporter family protein n=1 Tax=Pseudodesulfovibrio cashew TaxID=2678688 RepID=A0A6I6JJY1_9BACT|nr:multidrug resistance efflux transporter family protein [Pseudodesulfovibrio cashew]QGY40653.1 multidrug resistance efflux transporter family protein [Pseudodesulfovibrio cashew]
MFRILLTGCLAALFFSSTFVLNRAMSLDGGHWVWSASLRYFWMLLLLAGWLAVSGRARLGIETLKLFRKHWIFWTVAGSVGFGVFYALITFSSVFTPGWVVAATWQLTILATPFVLLGFGRRVPLRAILLTLVIFAGVLLINVEQAATADLSSTLWGALPVLVAAFAYPFGNQLVWEARKGEKTWLPAIDHPAMDDSICRVLLLTLGSLPLWGVLIAVVSPPPPSTGQLVQTGIVAVCSGVVATSLFLYARHQAANTAELAAADCTQSMEVVFSLLGEALLLGHVIPGMLGWIGIGLTMLGLILYVKVQATG